MSGEDMMIESMIEAWRLGIAPEVMKAADRLMKEGMEMYESYQKALAIVKKELNLQPKRRQQ